MTSSSTEKNPSSQKISSSNIQNRFPNLPRLRSQESVDGIEAAFALTQLEAMSS
jgi:hypothetical protein